MHRQNITRFRKAIPSGYMINVIEKLVKFSLSEALISGDPRHYKIIDVTKTEIIHDSDKPDESKLKRINKYNVFKKPEFRQKQFRQKRPLEQDKVYNELYMKYKKIYDDSCKLCNAIEPKTRRPAKFSLSFRMIKRLDAISSLIRDKKTITFQTLSENGINHIIIIWGPIVKELNSFFIQ